MAKITLKNPGQIILPQQPQHLPLKAGSGLVFETHEHGLMVHYVRLDARRAYLEVNSRCNLDCAMCVRQSWRDPQGMMSWDTFQSVVDGLRAFPDLKRVYLGGFGEPLMHPRIVDMVAQLNALGVGVTLSTNGLLLKPDLAEALFLAGVDTVVVSLDSMHVQAYEKGHHAVDTVLKNIHNVDKLIHDTGYHLPVLGLEYVATQSNLDDLYKLPNIAKQAGASFVIVTNLLPHTPEMVKETLYDRDEPLRMGGGWGIQRAGWIAWGTPRLARMKWGGWQRCRFVKDPSVVIGWDGGVSPCYALMHSYTYYIYGRRKEVTRYVLGSVRERSLADIWTSEEYVLFRAKVRDFRFPSCVDCGMDCSFAQENTDCYGNDPSCADCLWAQDIIQCP